MMVIWFGSNDFPLHILGSQFLGEAAVHLQGVYKDLQLDHLLDNQAEGKRKGTTFSWKKSRNQTEGKLNDEDVGS